MSWAERRAKRQAREAAGVSRGRKLLHPNASTPDQLEALERTARAADAIARAAAKKGDVRADQLRARANAARIDAERARRGQS